MNRDELRSVPESEECLWRTTAYFIYRVTLKDLNTLDEDGKIFEREVCVAAVSITEAIVMAEQYMAEIKPGIDLYAEKAEMLDFLSLMPNEDPDNPA